MVRCMPIVLLAPIPDHAHALRRRHTLQIAWESWVSWGKEQQKMQTNLANSDQQ